MLHVPRGEYSGDGRESPMPTFGGPLWSNVAITSDRVMDVDIRGVKVTGALTRNGSPMLEPLEPNIHEFLEFRTGAEHVEPGRMTFWWQTTPTTPSHYELVLMPGRYFVSYRGPVPNAPWCPHGPYGGGICEYGAIAGCL